MSLPLLLDFYFLPVTLNVFPAEQSVSVRSHMPGSVAMRTWGTPSYVRFSYTSSEMTTTCVFSRQERLVGRSV